MNKLKTLSNYLKLYGLNDQARDVIKLGQSELSLDTNQEKLGSLDPNLMKLLRERLQREDPKLISKDLPPSEEDEEDIWDQTENWMKGIPEVLPPSEEDEEDIWDKREGWMRGISNGLLITTSYEPIDRIKDSSSLCGSGPKPNGIWYAQGSDWLRFISIEAPFTMSEMNYIYSIRPNYSSGDLTNSSGGVLKLDTEDKILQFSKKYSKRLTGSWHEIYWPIVCSKWDGIEIIPHQNALTTEPTTRWYSLWDIASGCIWRPSGVSSLELISSRPGK
jgi:hypothetical protein